MEGFMKKRTIVFFLFLVSAFLLPLTAQEAPKMKIVVVDVDLVVLESTRGKAFIARIESERSEKEKLIKGKEDAYRNLQKKFENEKYSMNEEARRKMERDISDKKMDYQRFLEDQEIEMRRIYEQGLKELQMEITPVMNEMAKREGYSLVLNKIQSGIVYADDAIDITDKLVKEYDQKDASGQFQNK
jgi:outer membrane protein